jgi:hypothetical protein
MIEHSCDDWHDDDVVSKGPKQVYLDEKVALFNESHQSQYLVQVLRKDDYVCCVDV